MGEGGERWFFFFYCLPNTPVHGPGGNSHTLFFFSYCKAGITMGIWLPSLLAKRSAWAPFSLKSFSDENNVIFPFLQRLGKRAGRSAFIFVPGPSRILFSRPREREATLRLLNRNVP